MKKLPDKYAHAITHDSGEESLIWFWVEVPQSFVYEAVNIFFGYVLRLLAWNLEEFLCKILYVFRNVVLSSSGKFLSQLIPESNTYLKLYDILWVIKAGLKQIFFL